MLGWKRDSAENGWDGGALATVGTEDWVLAIVLTDDVVVVAVVMVAITADVCDTIGKLQTELLFIVEIGVFGPLVRCAGAAGVAKNVDWKFATELCPLVVVECAAWGDISLLVTLPGVVPALVLSVGVDCLTLPLDTIETDDILVTVGIIEGLEINLNIKTRKINTMIYHTLARAPSLWNKG